MCQGGGWVSSSSSLATMPSSPRDLRGRVRPIAFLLPSDFVSDVLGIQASAQAHAEEGCFSWQWVNPEGRGPGQAWGWGAGSAAPEPSQHLKET